MNILYLDGNYIIGHDDVRDIQYTFPRTNSYYDEEKDSFMIKRLSGTNELLIPFKEVGLWNDDLGIPYTEVSLRAFLRTNTDFKAALGGSSAVKVAQIQDNFSSLVPGTVVGEIAYTLNSEGTRWLSSAPSWLTGTLGTGTYFPQGWYVWNGTEWESDRNAIANQLENNIIKITANDNDIDQILLDLAQEIIDRTQADLLKANVNHTHTISDITDFDDSDYATFAQGLNADTAFSWGDHNLAGYLESFTETDPIFTSSPSFNIGVVDINNWNTAFFWGDHSTEGYLTSFTETDPVFQASSAFNIEDSDITNWDTAFSWDDHSIQGYLTSFTETDPIFTASPSFDIEATDINNWNTAFSWGDHSTEGYLTSFSETDPIFTASEAFNFVAGDKVNLDNQSGINTGDETTASIQTKRPLNTIEGQSIEGTGNIDLSKSDVGLDQVDNTSDLDKIISDDTQSALDDKLDVIPLTDPLDIYLVRVNAAGDGYDYWRDFFQVNERTDGLINQQNGVYETFLSVTYNIKDAGDYLLSYSMIHSMNNTTLNFEAHMEVNGTDIYPIHIESKDSGGVGQILPVIQGGVIIGNANTGTDQFLNNTGDMIITLPAGNNTILLEWSARGAANLEAAMYRALMKLKRIP